MINRRRLALAALAPLSLALAACGGSDESAGTPAGEPIAPIAAPAGQSWVDTAVVTPEGGYRIGNPEAPLKLVEYASHTCPHCANFAAEAKEPLDEYVASGRVSFELRNQIHDPLDLTVAMLARCGSPESFHPLATQAWGNLDAMVNAVQSNPAAYEQAIQGPEGQRYQRLAEAAGLLDFFAARGISRDQALQCLANTQQATQLAQNSNTQSTELEVTGTPTFFLNGARIEGTDWASVRTALQQAGAR